jgi:prepilin-type N-terminal cleavage/methylation domain-containing protein
LANPAGIADAGFTPMKTRCSKRRNYGLTLVEILVVVFILAILVAMILPYLARAKTRSGISCVNNLKQIGLAYRIWAGDNGDKFPMDVSVTNGGTMEIFAKGSQFQNFVFLNYLAMTNELSTPKILTCPADPNVIVATNFSTSFSAKNISYFVGLDADETNPQTLLSGDDNFEIGGAPVQSGLLEFSLNSPIAWSATRHKLNGNLLLSDGSVQQTSQNGLREIVASSHSATNRILIP